MGKQVYADNVDANAVAYPTIGENIRDGAKSAESVVKALQSDEITFDMQAVMNVLPFMDSSKKIIREVITCNENSWIDGEYFHGTLNSIVSKITCYAIMVGKITRAKDASVNSIAPIIMAPSGENRIMGVYFTASVQIAGSSIELFAVVDK